MSSVRSLLLYIARWWWRVGEVCRSLLQSGQRAAARGGRERAARWQRRAAKEAAQSRPWPGERETTIVNIEQLRAAASGSAGAGAEADQPSPTLE